MDTNDKTFEKSNFEILFIDSPEYFGIKNARMLQEGAFVRFICFDKDNKFKCDIWHPVARIHRIKRN